MKRSVRSTLDPLPRSISLKSLALLVAMLLAGVGVSVHEYLDSRSVPDRLLRPASSTLGAFTRDEDRRPTSAAPSCQPRSELPGSTGDHVTVPKPHPTASTQPAAPTESGPEGETWSGSDEGRASSASDR